MRFLAFGFGLLVSLAALGCVEGALRLLGIAPVEPYGLDAARKQGIFVYDPDLFWRQRPGYTETQPAPGGGVWDVRVDAEGFRTDPFPEEPPPGLVGILGVGDSTMWGDRVPQDQRYLDLAVARVRPQVPAPGVALTNAACPGYGSTQWIRLLPRLLATGRYRVVVMQVMTGDVYLSSRPDAAFEPRPLLGPFSFFARRSVLLRWLRTFGGERGVMGDFGLAPELAGPLDHRVPARPDFLANLTSLVRQSQRAGAEVLLLQPFRFWSPGAGSGPNAWCQFPAGHLQRLVEGGEAYRGVVAEVGRNAGAPVIDLDRLVAQDADPASLYADFVHPSVRGHARIADLLSPALLDAVRRARIPASP